MKTIPKNVVVRFHGEINHEVLKDACLRYVKNVKIRKEFK